VKRHSGILYTGLHEKRILMSTFRLWKRGPTPKVRSTLRAVPAIGVGPLFQHDYLNHKIALALCAFVFAAYTASAVSAEPSHDGKKTFTLWQLPSRTPTQNMSYVIRTLGGRIVVVDGGNKGDAEYLRGFLAPLGNRVAAWFVSHPHPDHVDALTDILQSPGRLQIERIYGSIPDDDWIVKHEPQPPSHLQSVQAFNNAVHHTGQPMDEVSLGQTIDIDELKIEILGIKNPEITTNSINNSSIVVRISDNHKSVLFTGDLGVEGGRKLLESKYHNRLQSDYVQMAHHGQAGVDINFYIAVRPHYCLWPTPAWLWNNDSGAGEGSGPWQTLKVRKWMEGLNVEQHYVSSNGLIRID
jgi:beta-lactamase superfamily II metal-dependent hydrolase